MSGKNNYIGAAPFIIDSIRMQELEEEYAKIVPTVEEMRYYGDAFRIRRAIVALKNVMKKYQLDLGVVLESKP